MKLSVRSPLYTENVVKQELMRSLAPNRVSSLLCPVTWDAQEVWAVESEEAIINAPYVGAACALNEIKEDPANLARTISERSNAKSTYKKYNNLVETISKHGGYGEGGLASKAQVGQLGACYLSLVHKLEGSSIIAEKNFRIRNPLKKKACNTRLSYSELYQAHRVLKPVSINSLGWQAFTARYSSEADEDSLWVFSLPEIWEHRSGVEYPNHDFSEYDLSVLCNVLASKDNKQSFSGVRGRVLILFNILEGQGTNTYRRVKEMTLGSEFELSEYFGCGVLKNY